MPRISIIPDFRPLADERLLRRAEALTPSLHHSLREPVRAFRLPERANTEREELAPSALPQQRLCRGESLCLDFGEHLVGYVTLELSCAGSHQDAPALLHLKFAEVPAELEEKAEDYAGWLSRSWIQEEQLHVDELPARLTLPRRFAFRYLQITVVDTSPKYSLVVRRAECRTESAADYACIVPRQSGDERLDRIHRASLLTLAGCMQEIFEDGPKRDRRLWVGDLRLQALSNYVSFRRNDLVKRCLYLFAGSRFPDGRISADVFTKPAPEADDTFYFDYALLYVAALEEYLQETADQEALDDLYGAAMDQIDYALAQCTPEGLVRPEAVETTFFDWCDALEKTACTQAVLIYALGYACRLARRRGESTREAQLRERRAALCRTAMERFWREEEGCFVSGGQISAASQIWMVLAGVPDAARALSAMKRAAVPGGEVRMATPYLHHYYVMALLQVGLREEAVAHIKSYWGGMLDAGADTFWECWDPQQPDQSPYGGLLVNSYCHAWSCTPAYIIDRFLLPAAASPEAP